VSEPMELPSIEQMHKDLIRGGWEKVMSGVYKAPWGAMFRGPVLAWKIWAGVEKGDQ
jgi:hypothetical protein